MTAVEQLVEEVEVISNSTGISRIEKIELYNKAIEKAKTMEKEQSLKMPPYNLDELAEKLLYKKYPYHPPSETGYWMDMYKEGFKKALELLTFKSE